LPVLSQATRFNALFDNLREVSAILAAKAPGDAPAFKAWLSSISQKVAEASSDHPPKGITLGKFRALYNNPALNRVRRVDPPARSA
jgi:hypothetical protein